MDNTLELKLYKNDICFGMGQSGAKIENILDQLKKHNVISIERLGITLDNGVHWQDEFTMKITQGDTILEERTAWISTYKQNTVSDSIMILENITVITKNESQINIDKALLRAKANLRLSGFDIKITEEGEQLIKDRLNGTVSNEEFKKRMLELIKEE